MEKWKIISLADVLSEGNLCHTSGLDFYTNSKKEAILFVENVENFKETKTRAYQRDGKYEVYVGTGMDTRFVKGQVPWNKKKSAGKNRKYKKSKKCGAKLWIEELGLTNKKSPEKFIPPQVYNLSLENTALFIGVLWSGDGFIYCKNNTVPYYATSSKRMAMDVQNLLLKLDIVSSIIEKMYKYKYKEIGRASCRERV